MDSCDSNGRSRRDGQNQTMNSNHAYQTVGLPQGLFECKSAVWRHISACFNRLVIQC